MRGTMYAKEPWCNPRDVPLFDSSTQDDSLEYMEAGWPDWTAIFASTSLSRCGDHPRMRPMLLAQSAVPSAWWDQMLGVSDEDTPTRVPSEEYWVDDYDSEEYILVIN